MNFREFFKAASCYEPYDYQCRLACGERKPDERGLVAGGHSDELLECVALDCSAVGQEPDRPYPHIFVLMFELSQQPGLRRAAARRQRPHHSQLASHVGSFVEQFQ